MPAVASARANNTVDGQKDRQVCRLSHCPGSMSSRNGIGSLLTSWSPNSSPWQAEIGFSPRPSSAFSWRVCLFPW